MKVASSLRDQGASRPWDPLTHTRLDPAVGQLGELQAQGPQVRLGRRRPATTGALGYVEGRLVAWCNASARCQYPDWASGEESEDTTTGVVTCFAVAPTHRGHGLARRPLAAVLGRFAEAGMTAVEAHPATDPKWPGAAYRGTMPLYCEHGFDVVGQSERTTTVRRPLAR